ncbi:eCIS core domain-containing protein [Streptomyces sp. B21-083]|uniref:eCIS core domain-containing protein n=1 Tax=Streptomyces sp. B21-083 TaxID=3039410 RepID=UPI003FA6AB36
MLERDDARANAAKNEGPTTARKSRAGGGAPSSARLALQSSAGNAAVVQMLRTAGHSWAQEKHQHGAGCGHQQAEQPEVQRSAVHDVLRSGGSPLDDATRTDMESRLGADFSDVRIHNDSAAKASAAEVGARAYTSGSHVVIGDGGGDQHTLAHELTHVIQQRQGPVAGTDNGSGLKVSDPSDRFEREAEANATRVTSGPAVQRAEQQSREAPTAQSAGQHAVQRAPDTENTVTEVSIAEGEVDEVGPGGTITYPSVTSCLTITVYLRDGGKVGGHASLYQVPGGLYSDQILPAIKSRVGKRRVESVSVRGAVSSWNPKYLTKAIERYSEAPPEQTNDPKGVGAVVANALDRQPKKVSVSEAPDGTLTA